MVDSFPGRERLAGYQVALDEAGIPADASLVRLGRFPDDGARKAALELLISGPAPPTAILAVNNQAVLGVMKALHDLGMECPRDISIAGFRRLSMGGFIPAASDHGGPAGPRDRREIGDAAARADGGKERRPARHVVLEGQFIRRESCQALDQDR